MRSLILLSALCGLSTAHFIMEYPESIGFSDDNESTGPCGGFTPDLSSSDKMHDFHVGGQALAMKLLHPQGNWLFRVTLDGEAKSGWEQVFPIVQQSGLGDFCEPVITLPDKYIGKKGVVGVVSDAADGLLYQCIAANFVKGSEDAPSACKNSSTVKASFVSDSKLSALVGSGSDSGSGSSSTGASGTPAPSKTGDAASATATPDAAASLRATGFGLALAVLGAAFVI